MKMAECDDAVFIQTEFLPDCHLKNIYLSEGVNYAYVYFLNRKKISEERDRVFYCSVATHERDDFTEIEKIIIKASLDKLKSKIEEL
jgi:hypothetical protein